MQLRGHDFTGLGFNVTGNMRDGIFVKDILNRGPAFESGRIAQGKPSRGWNGSVIDAQGALCQQATRSSA